MRTAKACGPDLPTLGSSLARRFAGRRWLSSPVHRGERAISRKTIAQGKAGCPVEPVVLTRVLSTMHTRLRVQAAPGLPCALWLHEGNDHANLGRIGVAGRFSHVRSAVSGILVLAFAGDDAEIAV